MRVSAVMISSTMPSTKYSRSGSPLILAKGSTAIDGLSERAGLGLPGIGVEANALRTRGRGGPRRPSWTLAARQNAARLGEAFDAGRDIDAVAKDVAHVDAHPELDPAVGRRRMRLPALRGLLSSTYCTPSSHQTWFTSTARPL
jgi:hypothetical protein